MARFSIYSKDGNIVKHSGEPKYSGSYLNVPFVEFNVESPSLIDWEIGDYVDYYRTGFRYRLYSLPEPKKQARANSYGAAFVYSNVKFYEATKELEIALFRDLVPDDNKIHFSTRPDVSTYENVYGIAGRIQECMDDMFPGKWRIEVYETEDADLKALFEETKEFSVSNGTCLDALSQIYESWKNVGWVHTYDSATDIDVITIGATSIRTEQNTTDAFSYGMGNGLTSIRKASANEGEFATRLYVYGSERNIQTRHYNQFDIVDKDSVNIVNLMIPLDKWGTTDGLPDAKKAYLQADDETVAKYGLIPRVVYFDGNGNDDIYPSIQGLTMSDVRQAMIESGNSASQYLPQDLNLRIDVIGSTNYDQFDDGTKEDYESNPTFWVGIRNLGFDIVEQGKLTEEGYATISMKSGMCAGREFKVKKLDGPIYGDQAYGRYAYVLEKVWDDSIGMAFPNKVYDIKQGDEFVLLDIPMPDYYIDLAQKRLYEAGEKMLADYTRVSAFYEPGINPIKIKLGGKIIRQGMYMKVYDEDIIDTPDHTDYVLIDTLTIDEKAELPSYKVTLREQKRSARTFGTLEDMIEDVKESTKEDIRKERAYTERRFRAAQETAKMLEDAFAEYSSGIRPAFVNTMQLLVGNEALQFKFTPSVNTLTEMPCPLSYDSSTRQMTASSSALVHLTMGIETISSVKSQDVSSYKRWSIPSYGSEILEDAEARYVYVEAPKNGSSATYALSKTSIEMDATDSENYYFLVGILNSEYAGEREFVTLYGFTEVLPGQITTDVIRSADGKTYFDLVNGKIGGNITFITSEGYTESLADFADYQNGLNQQVQDQIDGVVENWSAKGKPTILNYPASEWDSDAQKIMHLNDTYVNIEEYVDDEQTPDAGKAWRWCQCGEDIEVHSLSINFPYNTSEETYVGQIPIKDYGSIKIYRSGQLITFIKNFSYDTRMSVDSGPPATIYVNSKTGEVHITDMGNYLAGSITIYFNIGVTLANNNQGMILSLHWHPIADSDAVKALQKVADIEYLTKTFGKGETNISGGVVMTNMVAVKDSGSKEIEAFLNGSNFAEDAEHKKLILAAGIPDGLSNLDERAKEASTRIYEDGTIDTQKLNAKSGKISVFEINESWLKSKGENHDTRISSAFIGTSAQDYEAGGVYNTEAHMQAYPSALAATMGHSVIYSSIDYQPEDSDSEAKAVAVYASAKGANTAKQTSMYSEFGGSYAFYSPYGMFAGLRPKCVVLRDGQSYWCNALDHTLISFSEVEYTNRIYLPQNPQDGQVIKIWKTNTHTLYIQTSDTRNIVRMRVGTQSSWGIDSAFFGTIDLIYHSTIGAWLMLIHETY